MCYAPFAIQDKIMSINNLQESHETMYTLHLVNRHNITSIQFFFSLRIYSEDKSVTNEVQYSFTFVLITGTN